MLTVDILTEKVSKTPRYLHIHIYKKALAKSILHKPWISKKKNIYNPFVGKKIKTHNSLNLFSHL